MGYNDNTLIITIIMEDGGYAMDSNKNLLPLNRQSSGHVNDNSCV